MLFFFHVSPAKLTADTFVNEGVRGYVCLATSLEQALYWGWALYGKGCRRHDVVFEDLTVYVVEVQGEMLVEDCVGHYAFERPGVEKKAGDVNPHYPDLDGEVITRCPVMVVGKTDIDYGKWREWAAAYEVDSLRRW